MTGLYQDTDCIKQLPAIHEEAVKYLIEYTFILQWKALVILGQDYYLFFFVFFSARPTGNKHTEKLT